MADTLKTIITAADTRPVVVSDCLDLVENEVSKKGLIIRGAFKTVKKIKPGFVKSAIDGLLDEWIEKTEPFYTEWSTNKEGSFRAHLVANQSKVADQLLTVTDERAKGSKHKTAAKLYGKLRPSALKHVESAVPGLGSLLEKHLG